MVWHGTYALSSTQIKWTRHSPSFEIPVAWWVHIYVSLSPVSCHKVNKNKALYPYDWSKKEGNLKNVSRNFSFRLIQSNLLLRNSPMKKVTECDSLRWCGLRYFLAFLRSSSAKCLINRSSTSSDEFITCRFWD